MKGNYRLAAVFFFFALLLASTNAQQVNFEVMLVEALNGDRKKDPKLSRIESALHLAIGRRYDTFKYVGGVRKSINVPGKAALELGAGYAASIEARALAGDRVTAKVRWTKGKTIVDTTFSASKGTPTVYARPQGSRAKLLVIIPR